ncbi:MAG: phosphodiesterase [Bacilli bacterium]|nr:phosphodiesterase [Bacilli bacterium]
MKLLIASDIHGSLYYTKLLIDKFNKEKCDRLILLGDILYHGPRNPVPKDYEPKEVANLLNQYKDKIICVRGNCDSEVDQMILEFPVSSAYSYLLIDNYTFFLTHGHLYNPEQLPLTENSIYVYGHTHIPVLENSSYIKLNPGSISLPKDNYEPTYALYEDGKIIIKTFENKVLWQIQL